MVILNSTAQLIEDQTVAVLGPHLGPSRLSWLIETSGTFIITPTGSPYSYQIYFSFARGIYRLDCVEIHLIVSGHSTTPKKYLISSTSNTPVVLLNFCQWPTNTLIWSNSTVF